MGPSLTITLGPETLISHVTSSENGPVIFNGNVSVDRYVRGLRVTVSLMVQCLWTAILSPSTMGFSSSGSEPFSVTVVVPPATERNKSSSVIVDGYAKAAGMPAIQAQAEATVVVAPYYKAHLGLPIETVEARRGSTTTLMCNLSNECNGPMRLQVKLVSPTEGITLQAPDSVSLQQDSIVDIPLELEVASNFPTGRQQLQLQVVFLEAEPGTPPSTHQMSLDVVPALGRSGAPVLIVAIVAIVVAVVVLYLWRTRWAGRPRVRSAAE